MLLLDIDCLCPHSLGKLFLQKTASPAVPHTGRDCRATSYRSRKQEVVGSLRESLISCSREKAHTHTPHHDIITVMLGSVQQAVCIVLFRSHLCSLNKEMWELLQHQRCGETTFMLSLTVCSDRRIYSLS